MIDYVRITVKAGNGGNGVGSFHKIKGRRYGKADGGDGGRGGDVYIETTSDLSGLDKYRFVKDYSAWSGQAGLSRLRRGAAGEDLILKVPVGTVVRLSSYQDIRLSGDKKPDDHITRLPDNLPIFDFVESGQKVLIARGGEGGRGNAKLRDDFGRRPRAGEKGEQGEALALTLELKLIADVGLIGLPNAGKSTLLAQITRARPEIAPYPFTTLEPNLGVMNFAGPVSSFLPASARSSKKSIVDQQDNVELRAVGSPSTAATRSTRLIIADIPGLIEGASAGRGLGDLFLRHIERTRLLVHLLDGSSSADVWGDYQTIRSELAIYSKDLPAGKAGLSKKKEIIAINKIDQMSESVKEKARVEFKKHRKKIFFISASLNSGISELVKEIIKRLS